MGRKRNAYIFWRDGMYFFVVQNNAFRAQRQTSIFSPNKFPNGAAYNDHPGFDLRHDETQAHVPP